MFTACVMLSLCFAYSSNLNMRMTRFSETSIDSLDYMTLCCLPATVLRPRHAMSRQLCAEGGLWYGDCDRIILRIRVEPSSFLMLTEQQVISSGISQMLAVVVMRIWRGNLSSSEVREHVEGWRYRSTIVELGTRWR